MLRLLAGALFRVEFFGLSLRGWYFNPFAWQFLFTLGAWAALGGAARAQSLARSRFVLAASVVFVLLALIVTMAVRFGTAGFMPAGELEIVVPNDKTNLAPYRVLHFLALAVIVVLIIPKDWAGLNTRLLRPLVLCGQRSLEVFCVGIFLSFVGHFILEMYSDRLPAQIGVSLGGLILMTCVASYRTWSRKLDAPPPTQGVRIAKNLEQVVPVHKDVGFPLAD
jgi:hypothetical protein